MVNYYNWYENEATIPQKAVADKILTPIVERIDAADGSSTIRYGMDKQVQERWMFRSEAGFIGNRKSFLVSLNYRFLL